jgi:hypothetical protein
MEVLVDSCVWSVAIRRRSPEIVHRRAVERLIADSGVRIIGPIRQECLSGVADPAQYAHLRDFFRTFPDIPLVRDDHELAASFYNTCRSHGVQGSHTDFLICAVAERLELKIYTTDADFNAYAAHIPIRRYRP